MEVMPREFPRVPATDSARTASRSITRRVFAGLKAGRENLLRIHEMATPGTRGKRSRRLVPKVDRGFQRWQSYASRRTHGNLSRDTPLADAPRAVRLWPTLLSGSAMCVAHIEISRSH
jgi:hypothetical protein